VSIGSFAKRVKQCDLNSEGEHFMKRIAIIGAGGFAREVSWLVEEISAANPPRDGYFVAGFLVSDTSLLGPHDSPILGDFSWLETNEVDALALGVGNPALRLRLAGELKQRFPRATWPALVHPAVRWQRHTMMVGEGVIICAGNIATVNVTFEPYCMVNLSCTIGHEALIGRGSVLNPTVNISGGVKLGHGVLVGTGAQILQYVKVGNGATVGAGALVNKDVQAGASVVGVPAKELVRHAPAETSSVSPQAAA
jgi:sugar O-acyltransferase (sialic acid O-acetyltransferase NeuD family)